MVVNRLRPGVYTREFDITQIVPSVSTTEAAIAGQFVWGPVNERILIDSEKELVQTFGKPNNTTANDFFSAADYLSYADKLWTVRVVDETNSNTSLRATNSTVSNSAGFLVKNDDDYEINYADGSLDTEYNVGEWIAKYPGELGDSIKVSICPSADAYQSTLTGSVTVSANSSTVTGAGTTFDTEIVVGDLLVINGEVNKVTTVTNATSLIMQNRHISGASANTAVRRWEYYPEVNNAPGTSPYTEGLNGTNDEMHIVVVDADGEWTNIPGSILEVYQKVSKALDAKADNGETTYYKNAVNQKSSFIRWASHTPTLTNAGARAKGINFANPDLPVTHTLSGGSDGVAVGNDEKIRGYDLFRAIEDVDISLVIGSDANQTIAVHIINNIVESRQDCIALLSPPRNTVVDNKGNEAIDVVNFRNLLPSTSYAVLDNNWKFRYDQYNDVYRFVPMCGDTAGLHARTDLQRDPWWAAAGLNRGQVKNVIKLAWNPRNSDQEYCYKNGVNNYVTFRGEGTVLWGNKTMLSRPSAFESINVRRLFIVLRKAIAKAARYFLFEINDEFTRASFRNMVEPYLREIQGRRGINEFRVICDSTNNTPDVIDRSEMIGAVYVKPARVAEFIQLDFIAVNNSVSFDEIAGKYG